MIQIRELEHSEYENALQLSWDVFQEYEAPDYSEQGVRTFYASIHNPDYLSMLRIYGAFDNEALVGIFATRSEGNHIALFFVEGKYHRRGIGRQLWERGCLDNISGKMTVNSSPYAAAVYHRFGFVDTDTEQLMDGIRFTPMKWCKGEQMTGADRNNNELIVNTDRLHTTELGKERIRRNLCLEVEDVVGWCRQKIEQTDSRISRKGKNWYINVEGCEITVNAYSYTIITAHKEKKKSSANASIVAREGI